MFIIGRASRPRGGGTKVVARLSADLVNAFPNMKGLSPRNLHYMRAFAAAWPDRESVQRIAAQIPWRQIRFCWYAEKVRQEGWSRDVLALQIDGRLHEREGQAVHNFPATLPPPTSDLAAQVFKDPYLFDFLGTADPRWEAEVEQALPEALKTSLPSVEELEAALTPVPEEEE